TLGFPRPRNRVERALQLAAAGHQPGSVLMAALADAVVVIPTSAEHPGQVPVVQDNGADTIMMFTHEELLEPDTPRVTTPARTLPALLETVTVVINPGCVPSVRIPGAALALAVPGEPQ